MVCYSYKVFSFHSSVSLRGRPICCILLHPKPETSNGVSLVFTGITLEKIISRQLQLTQISHCPLHSFIFVIHHPLGECVNSIRLFGPYGTMHLTQCPVLILKHYLSKNRRYSSLRICTNLLTYFIGLHSLTSVVFIHVSRRSFFLGLATILINKMYYGSDIERRFVFTSCFSTYVLKKYKEPFHFY